MLKNSPQAPALATEMQPVKPPLAPRLMLCEHCQTAHSLPRLARRQSAHCQRCGHLLMRYNWVNSEAIFAVSLAAMLVLVMLLVMPLVTLNVMGVSHTVTLPLAMLTAWQQGGELIAVLAFVCLLLIPALQLSLLLWLTGFSIRGRRAPGLAPITRLLHLMHPWGMVEVLFLGVLVALVKLGGMFEVVAGGGMLALLGLMLLVTVSASWDTRQLWRLLAPKPRPTTGAMADNNHATALASGSRLAGCHVCGQVSRLASGHGNRASRCPRCRAHLSMPSSASRTRCLALLISAIILYLPANLLPVMSTQSLLFHANSTLLGGVVSLWQSGAWDLALIVFSASVLVPVLKFVALALLLWRSRQPRASGVKTYARLYRVVERLGYWSMLDVFVVLTLTAMVQLTPLAQISPLSGITWFALVVVLTMLASMSFDPRLMWRPLKSNSSEPSNGR